MFNRNFFLSLCLIFTLSAKAQYLTTGEGSEFSAETLQSNFDEFSPVFESFLNQARQMIAQKNYKQARESLAPFLQHLRIRLGFNSKSFVDLVLKNHTAEQTDQVQREMIGAHRFETSFHYVSSNAKDAAMIAIRSSLPTEYYLDSILKYKRTLLISLQASLGEYDSYAGQDKKYVGQQMGADFLFLVAPALRFQTANPELNLVIFEHEINHSNDQMRFEAELTDLVQSYWEYFDFARSQKSADVDYRTYKMQKITNIRRSLMLRVNRKPSSEPDEVAETALPTQVETPVVAPASLQDAPTGIRRLARPSAEVSKSALGSLQFDLSSLYEIDAGNQPVDIEIQQLKDYLLSSTMIWGQRRIEYNSSFTHSNSTIKVLVRNFPLNENFISASVKYYLQDLTVFYRHAKEALIKSNQLSTRDAVYNCLVRQSLAPQSVNCDELVASVSMYDENVRRMLTNSYTRLLRYSRITFEHSQPLDYAPETQTACDQLKTLQVEMLASYKSNGNSYLPSLMNLQGPSFKNLVTGQRDYLCQLSLNPLLQ